LFAHHDHVLVGAYAQVSAKHPIGKAVLPEKRPLGSLSVFRSWPVENAYGNETARMAPAHGLILAAGIIGRRLFMRSTPAAVVKHGLADFIAEEEDYLKDAVTPVNLFAVNEGLPGSGMVGGNRTSMRL